MIYYYNSMTILGLPIFVNKHLFEKKCMEDYYREFLSSQFIARHI